MGKQPIPRSNYRRAARLNGISLFARRNSAGSLGEHLASCLSTIPGGRQPASLPGGDNGPFFFTFDALKQAPSYEDGCARKQHIGHFELWAG